MEKISGTWSPHKTETLSHRPRPQPTPPPRPRVPTTPPPVYVILTTSNASGPGDPSPGRHSRRVSTQAQGREACAAHSPGSQAREQLGSQSRRITRGQREPRKHTRPGGQNSGPAQAAAHHHPAPTRPGGGYPRPCGTQGWAPDLVGPALVGVCGLRKAVLVRTHQGRTAGPASSLTAGHSGDAPAGSAQKSSTGTALTPGPVSPAPAAAAGPPGWTPWRTPFPLLAMTLSLRPKQATARTGIHKSPNLYLRSLLPH